jgi:sugar fermentation stimulation protein A
MDFDFDTIAATFLERPNRYRIRARLVESGDIVDAHCADPGRLQELLLPGARVHLSRAVLSPHAAQPRKTAWDLRLVEHPVHGQLISLDTRVPNRLFEEGWRAGFFSPLQGYAALRREVPHPLHEAPSSAGLAMTTRKRPPHSRADFLLADAFTADAPLALPGRRCWVEVKSASLVVDRIARFPDAVTERGRRHLAELAALQQRGERAAVVFIVQRPDADAVTAHRATDPAFADALDAAAQAGVTLLAATCSLSTTSIMLERLIPVTLSA